MLKIGLDIGYGYTKAVASNGREVIFPSLIGEGFQRRYEGILGSDHGSDIENIHVEMDKRHFFVGKLASLESKNCSLAFDQNKISHISTGILLAASVLLLMEDEDSIALVAGLPFSYYVNQRSEFRQYLSNFNKEVTLHRGKNKITRQIRFNIAETFPQSVGAIFQIAKNYKFDYGLVGCIDIGTKTTDITVFTPEGMKIIENLSGTIETGAYVIHSYIAREIEMLTGMEAGTFNLEQILRNGNVTRLRGKEINLTKAVQEGKRDLSRKIKDEIALKWAQKLDNFSMVFLVGGGAELLKETIQDIYYGSIVPDNPEMLNAKGFAIVANSLAERYMV